MNTTQSDVKEHCYFADNKWRKAQGNRTFDVHEPYNGKIFGRTAASSGADARIAVDAAAKARG
jgi:acyl-CoA reductase-like NAD-dependent aldehyde dehydrogenase